jgi:serine/threonine-protein kinase
VLFRLKGKSSAANRTEPGPFGQYQLRELINSGGMADLWLATDKDNVSYALRLLHADLIGDSTSRKRFVQGCEILAQIPAHECVIGYVEHGKIEGTPYLLMEYVEGSNLKLMYADHDPVLLENVGNIIIDMARGLEHVHESGFMHLDFKPENVLVTRNAGVRVVDFDLALPMPKEPKKLAKTAGTPAYMAPEQLLGEPVDQRADIFAFGVATYELLTNYKPFPGETPVEILASQTNRSEFVQPLDYNPDIPPRLGELVVKCLQRDPNLRYPLMTVLMHDLQTALHV